MENNNSNEESEPTAENDEFVGELEADVEELLWPRKLAAVPADLAGL